MKAFRFLPKLSHFITGRPKSRDWNAAQAYEWRATVEFMSTESFRTLAQQIYTGDFESSTGPRDELMLGEFFGGNLDLYNSFLEDIRDKKVLDIGPCLASPLSNWDETREKFIVEPLLPKVVPWQRDRFGFSLFDGMTLFLTPAEITEPKLVGLIDAAIYCRNCIDHSPYWPFILANISKYAQRGCYLLLWSDIYHGESVDDGHFNIVQDSLLMRNLIEALGFSVDYEFSKPERGGKKWGCVATKN